MKKILFALILFTTVAKAQYIDKLAIREYYGSSTAMDTTALVGLATSATAGFQSARVSNLSTLARDYEIVVKMQMKYVSGTPAGSKAIYVYACPWYFDATATWIPADGGTTTLPSGSQGTYTIASPNSLTLLGILPYTTQGQSCQKTLILSNAFGRRIPDGFSLVIINDTGSADSLASLKYKPLY